MVATRYLIYGAPGSVSGIVEAACAELGLDYEVRDLDARAGEHLGAEYARLNPHRKMPTLVVETRGVEESALAGREAAALRPEVITESVAILLSLDERHPEARLLPPPGSRERAQALRWMLFLATELYPLVEWVDYPERLSAETAPRVRQRAETLIRERWRLLEEAIAGPYLVGAFSATDLYITKFAVWLDAAWRRDQLPKVDALCAAVRARPRLQRVWARHIRG